MQVKRLTTVPLDPLTGREYAYSVSADNTRYQLGGVSETSNISLLTQSVVAAGE
jgi:hypothetical protein